MFWIFLTFTFTGLHFYQCMAPCFVPTAANWALCADHRIGDSLIEVRQGPEISDADEAGRKGKSWQARLSVSPSPRWMSWIWWLMFFFFDDFNDLGFSQPLWTQFGRDIIVILTASARSGISPAQVEQWLSTYQSRGSLETLETWEGHPENRQTMACVSWTFRTCTEYVYALCIGTRRSWQAWCFFGRFQG